MKIKLTVCLLVLLSIFTGCSMYGLDMYSMICPPRSLDEMAKIKDVVQNTAGADIILKYPKQGEYRSAIIMMDIDNDGQDEAIVFYEKESPKSVVHMMIIDNMSGTWKSVGVFERKSIDVDQVLFADMHGNNINEIIVWFDGYNSKGKNISVYSYDGKNLRESSSEEIYSDFMLLDFDQDGCEEILAWPVYEQDGSSGVRPEPRLLKLKNREFKMDILELVAVDKDLSVLFSKKLVSFSDMQIRDLYRVKQ